MTACIARSVIVIDQCAKVRFMLKKNQTLQVFIEIVIYKSFQLSFDLNDACALIDCSGSSVGVRGETQKDRELPQKTVKLRIHTLSFENGRKNTVNGLFAKRPSKRPLTVFCEYTLLSNF